MLGAAQPGKIGFPSNIRVFSDHGEFHYVLCRLLDHAIVDRDPGPQIKGIRQGIADLFGLGGGPMCKRIENLFRPTGDSFKEENSQARGNQADDDERQWPGEALRHKKIQPPVSAGYEGLLFPPEQSEKIAQNTRPVRSSFQTIICPLYRLV